MFCHHCGERSSEDTRFCPACGKEATQEEAQVVSQNGTADHSSEEVNIHDPSLSEEQTKRYESGILPEAKPDKQQRLTRSEVKRQKKKEKQMAYCYSHCQLAADWWRTNRLLL